MQMVFDLKTVLIGAVVVVAGYQGYRYMFGELEGKNVGKLIQLYGESQPARQMIIKRRAVSLYSASRDHEAVMRALNSAAAGEQAIAVIILREKHDRRAGEKLLSMLGADDLEPNVQGELAGAMAEFKMMEAIPRLIELTDNKEEPSVRAAAHSALKMLTGAGAQVKLGTATRESWNHLWDDQLRRSVKGGKKGAR